MPDYMYKVRDRQGGMLRGVLQGESEQDVIECLDRMGYFVVSIDLCEQSNVWIQNIIDRFKKINRKDVILMTRELATLIRTGTPLTVALTAVYDQTENRRLKDIVKNIQRNVEEGTSLSDALSKYPAVFSELFISMIEVGESGGLLDKVLDRLAILGTQEMELNSRIQSAMLYPIVLMGIALIVVNFLIVGVLPKFVSIFESSEAALPLPTQIVMGMSWIARKYWYVILIIVGGVYGWFEKYRRSERGKFQCHKLMLALPIFGPLYRKIQVTRFARILSSLLSSGIPLLQALTVVEKTMSNVLLRRAIQNVRVALSEGQTLADPLRVSGLFPPMVVSMIATGERSGNLDTMLEEIASFYDPEIDTTVKNLTTLLEPFMLLAMGIMVAFISLAVLLPIFNMIKVFRG